MEKEFSLTEKVTCTAIECGKIRVECHANAPYYTARVINLRLFDAEGKGSAPSGAVEDLRLELNKLIIYLEKVIRESYKMFEYEQRENEK